MAQSVTPIPPASIFQGPLPTNYSPASTCTGISLDNIAVYNSAKSCQPKGFNTAGAVYYSPGTGCPTGFTAQPSCTRSAGSHATTTTITCCPVHDDLTMSCVADPNTLSGPWADMMCTWIAGDLVTALTVTTMLGDGPVTSSYTVSNFEGFNAYGLKMVYQSSDLTSSSRSTSRSTSSGPTSTGNQSADEDGGSSGGLSTGAKAAIGVVVPVVVIAVLIGAFFLFRRRRTQRAENSQPTGASELGHDASKEGGPQSQGGYSAVPPEELDASHGQRFEMDSGSQR